MARVSSISIHGYIPSPQNKGLWELCYMNPREGREGKEEGRRNLIHFTRTKSTSKLTGHPKEMIEESSSRLFPINIP